MLAIIQLTKIEPRVHTKGQWFKPPLSRYPRLHQVQTRFIPGGLYQSKASCQMDKTEYEICPICKKKYKKGQLVIIRESWIQAGGFGHVPPDARCHPSCDEQEQRKLKAGKIKLIDLWKKIN